MKEPDRIIDVDNEEVHAMYFHVLGNRYIFMAMQYLYEKKIKPTPLAVMEVLSSDEAKSEVEKLGGLEYLTILTETYLPPDNLPIFIEKLKQSYTRRTLYTIGSDMQSFVLSDKAEVLNPTELIEKVENQINTLQVNTSTTNAVYKMGDETDEILALRAETPAEVPGLEVGWPEYDKATNGAQPNDLIIICADTKTGKSITLNNWASKIAIQDKIPVLYINTEMSDREQEDRLLALLSGVPQSEIVSGMYMLNTDNGTASEKQEKLKRAKKMLSEGNYYHHYMPHFTIEKVAAIARKFQIQHGIKALFFDYIKIPSSNANFGKNSNEYQQLGYFTSGLKELAGTLNMPIFTACQANRNEAGTGKRKSAKDIGDSYRILQYASKLMFLTNKTDEQIAKDGISKGNQQLWIEWQRNGESGMPPINIFFDRPICKQTEISI